MCYYDIVCGREGVNGSHLSRLLRLTLSASDIVEAIRDGRQRKALASDRS
jgi:hypothetical protein